MKLFQCKICNFFEIFTCNFAKACACFYHEMAYILLHVTNGDMWVRGGQYFYLEKHDGDLDAENNSKDNLEKPFFD